MKMFFFFNLPRWEHFSKSPNFFVTFQDFNGFPEFAKNQ